MIADNTPGPGNHRLMPYTMWDPWHGVKDRYTVFGENTRHSITYRTDRDALQALLPPGFTATEEARLSVNYTMSRQIDKMAGGGYNLVGIDVDVVYQGKRDRAEGSYGLVVWMDKFIPVVVGREILGAAKLLAQVPEMTRYDGIRRFHLSEEGTRLIEGAVWDLKEMGRAEIVAREKAGQGKAWMGYKYVPRADLSGPDAAYATWLPVRRTVKKAWHATGEVRFLEAGWEQAPMSWGILSALRQLPILEYCGAHVQVDECTFLDNKILE